MRTKKTLLEATAPVFFHLTSKDKKADIFWRDAQTAASTFTTSQTLPECLRLRRDSSVTSNRLRHRKCRFNFPLELRKGPDDQEHRQRRETVTFRACRPFSGIRVTALSSLPVAWTNVCSSGMRIRSKSPKSLISTSWCFATRCRSLLRHWLPWPRRRTTSG